MLAGTVYSFFFTVTNSDATLNPPLWCAPTLFWLSASDGGAGFQKRGLMRRHAAGPRWRSRADPQPT